MPTAAAAKSTVDNPAARPALRLASGKDPFNLPFETIERRAQHGRTEVQDNVPLWAQKPGPETGGFANTSSRTVSQDRPAEGSGGGQTDARTRTGIPR
jgi:hypothetical protein